MPEILETFGHQFHFGPVRTKVKSVFSVNPLYLAVSETKHSSGHDHHHAFILYTFSKGHIKLKYGLMRS